MKSPIGFDSIRACHSGIVPSIIPSGPALLRRVELIRASPSTCDGGGPKGPAAAMP
jgi:hypothetical protein